MNKPLRLLFCVLSGAFCLSALGCGNNPHQAVNADAHNTFLSSNDMQAMTDQMAQSIISSPAIQQEWTKGPLKIVIKPVTNETNEIITDNRKEMFVARLQGLLAKNQTLDKFTWIINRSDYAKLIAEELPESQLGPSEDRVQPEYALYAVFNDDTKVTTKGESNTYLCEYRLTRLSGPDAGVELWSGQYQTSKHIKKSLLD